MVVSAAADRDLCRVLRPDGPQPAHGLFRAAGPSVVLHQGRLHPVPGRLFHRRGRRTGPGHLSAADGPDLDNPRQLLLFAKGGGVSAVGPDPDEPPSDRRGRWLAAAPSGHRQAGPRYPVAGASWQPDVADDRTGVDHADHHRSARFWASPRAISAGGSTCGSSALSRSILAFPQLPLVPHARPR